MADKLKPGEYINAYPGQDRQLMVTSDRDTNIPPEEIEEETAEEIADPPCVTCRTPRSQQPGNIRMGIMLHPCPTCAKII